MKIPSFLMLLLTICLVAVNQSCVQEANAMKIDQEIDTFFEDYQNDDNATALNLGGFALNLTMGDKNNKFESLRMLSFDSDNLPSKKKLAELKKNLNDKPMTLLGNIKDSDSQIEFYGIESEGNLTNLVMTLEENDKFVLLQVRGKFSKEALSKLDLDIDGLEMYEDIL
jgi:hypothetical protein